MIGTNSQVYVSDVEYLCLDLETTGLRSSIDNIVEIGLVKCTATEVLQSYQSFVNIGRPIPAEASKVNNITDDMLVDAPNIKEILEQFLLLAKDCVLVAHNISFDFSFINAELAQNGYDPLKNFPLVDTLELAKKAFPEFPSYSLEAVVGKLQIEIGQHHRALDDAEACRQVLFTCCDKLSILGELLLAEILL